MGTREKEIVTIRSSAAEYLTYVAASGDDEESVEMRYEDENIWLTQKMIATLYNVGVSTINEHIKKVFGDNELQEDVTIRKFRIVQQEGSRQVGRAVNHYSLQMIIAVGFKVNSERAVQFRKWVNQIAKEYTIKGWAMDDERLKRGTYLTDKYFDVCNPEIYGKEHAWSFEDNEIHMASHIYPLPEKLLNYLKDKYGYFKSYSQTVQSSYLANHCSNCKVIQGDFYLFGEVDSPFFIDSEERAKQLKLYKIPLKNDIIVEADIGWGSEDWMIEAFAENMDLSIDGMWE